MTDTPTPAMPTNQGDQPMTLDNLTIAQARQIAALFHPQAAAGHAGHAKAESR